jgi:hypothetical protein
MGNCLSPTKTKDDGGTAARVPSEHPTNNHNRKPVLVDATKGATHQVSDEYFAYMYK